MPALFQLVDFLSGVPDWHERALCREVDGDLFYPEKGVSGVWAKRICRRCDVRADCLAEALERDEPGIWAGLSQRERRALKRRAT